MTLGAANGGVSKDLFPGDYDRNSFGNLIGRLPVAFEARARRSKRWLNSTVLAAGDACFLKVQFPLDTAARFVRDPALA